MIPLKEYIQLSNKQLLFQNLLVE